MFSFYFYSMHYYLDAVPMIQQLESTLRANAVPQAPQFRPPTVASASQPMVSGGKSQVGEDKSGSVVKPAKREEKPVGEQEKTPANTAVRDPLGDSRSKVQEEITREFAAIMATGTLRASEAAALATKRVMQRYGHTTAALN